MGFKLQCVEHFLVLIHRQLASHLELSPLLVSLCLITMKDRIENRRKKKKKGNAIFNTIFLDIQLRCLPHNHPEAMTFPEERTVQL